MSTPLIRQRFALTTLAVLLLFPLVGCQNMDLTGPQPPVKFSWRKALLSDGLVFRIENTSDKTLNLWIMAHDKQTNFALAGGARKEFGHLEGYDFGFNSSCMIGGEGYSPVTFRPDADATRASRYKNVVESADGKYKPAPGYDFVTDAPSDMRVRWSPGKQHPKHPNVVASNTEGDWNPADGYRWAKKEDGDYSVVPK